MVRLGVERTWRGPTIVGAIFALAIHLAALGFLVMAPPRLLSALQDERAISVDLLRPPERPTSQTRGPSREAPAKRPSTTSPPAEPFHTVAPLPQSFATGVLPLPATPPANAPSAGRPVGLALRNSVIGCAFAGTVGLSDEQRRHCHDMFAAGRKNGPDLVGFGVDPSKKVAFDAAVGPGNFLQGPPKDGCKLFAKRPRIVTLGGEAYDAAAALGCGKTF